MLLSVNAEPAASCSQVGLRAENAIELSRRNLEQRAMRYFFDSHHDFTTLDLTGRELMNLSSACRHAMCEARAAAAYEVSGLGTLSLSHRIDVLDALGSIVSTVSVADAVRVRP